MNAVEDIFLCPCGHHIGGTHNGLGCYGRISYNPLVVCECKHTDEAEFDVVTENVNRLVVEAERRGAVQALREAADDIAYEVRRFKIGCEADAGYYDAHMEIRKMLRDRADEIEADQ